MESNFPPGGTPTFPTIRLTRRTRWSKANKNFESLRETISLNHDLINDFHRRFRGILPPPNFGIFIIGSDNMADLRQKWGDYHAE